MENVREVWPGWGGSGGEQEVGVGQGRCPRGTACGAECMGVTTCLVWCECRGGVGGVTFPAGFPIARCCKW